MAVSFLLLLFLFVDNQVYSQNPVDPKATPETKCLYKNLYKLSHDSKHFIFGHHHDNYQGQYFHDQKGLLNESDVKNNTGYLPGFIEYNLNALVSNNVNFTHHILNAISKGLMVGWNWAATNPVTGGSSKDCTGDPIPKLMPNGVANANWTKMLDKISEFIKSVRLSNGNLIPMTFRLFHECTGSWFWWGEEYCTQSQYIAAFNYTRWYLVEYHELHNLLFVYAPSKPYTFYGNDADKYLNDRYPGNDIIDVISMDDYDKNDFHQELVNNTNLIVNVSEKVDKIASIAEFGVSKGTQNTNISSWWMSSFYAPINEDANAWKIAYAQTWADFSNTDYWVPLKGQITYNSFIQMFQQDFTIFENNIPPLYSC